MPAAGAGASAADPKNQNYIAIPFICHLQEYSVTTQSWVIGPYKKYYERTDEWITNKGAFNIDGLKEFGMVWKIK